MPLKPMLAKAVSDVPEGDPNFVLQKKYDGWRAILEATPSGVKLYTRSGKEIKTVPYITGAFSHLPTDTILDGEIVDLSGDASGQWNRTQTICQRRKLHVPTPADPALTFVVFDLVELDGNELYREALRDRQKLLKALFALLPDGEPVELAENYPCEAQTYEQLVTQGWEGVVCKHLDSLYLPDTRNGGWVKIKPDQELDVEITGMFDPEPGSKYGGVAVGGFTFTVTHNEGTLINHRFDGKCGTGMDDDLRKDMLANPELYVGKVAVLAHCGIAPDTGALRFPSLVRIRDEADKSAVDVRAAVLGDGSTTKIELLNRALEAEEERDHYKDRCKDLEDRLGAAVKKAVGGPRTRKPKGESAGSPKSPKAVMPAASGLPTDWKRNYSAMGDLKLEEAIAQLRAERGDAYDRVVAHGAHIHAHRIAAESAAKKRGLTVV